MFGLDPATAGPEIRARLGYSPEHHLLPPDVKAVDFVRHVAEVHGLPRREATTRACDVLWQVGLGEERGRPIGTMSTGQRQRVKLAQALAHDPHLVLLDEPTDGLDPVQRDAMLELIHRIGHEFGITRAAVVAPARGGRADLRRRRHLERRRRGRRRARSTRSAGEGEGVAVEFDGDRPSSTPPSPPSTTPAPRSAPRAGATSSPATTSCSRTVRDAIAASGVGLRRLGRRTVSLEEVFLGSAPATDPVARPAPPLGLASPRPSPRHRRPAVDERAATRSRRADAQILDRGYRQLRRAPHRGARGAVTRRRDPQRAAGPRPAAHALGQGPARRHVGVRLPPRHRVRRRRRPDPDRDDARRRSLLPELRRLLRLVISAIMVFVALRRPRGAVHRSAHRHARRLPRRRRSTATPTCWPRPPASPACSPSCASARRCSCWSPTCSEHRARRASATSSTPRGGCCCRHRDHPAVHRHHDGRDQPHRPQGRGVGRDHLLFLVSIFDTGTLDVGRLPRAATLRTTLLRSRWPSGSTASTAPIMPGVPERHRLDRLGGVDLRRLRLARYRLHHLPVTR